MEDKIKMEEIDKFPRDKQNALLIRLYNTFPRILTEEEFHEIVEMFGSQESFAVNTWYLHAHGLIERVVYENLGGINSVEIGG